MPDVLLVEDDRVVLEAVAMLCRSEGLAVEETSRLEDAMAKLDGNAYRLAIVDLMLPRQSGFDLLPELAARQPALPVVTISGYATVVNALESFRLGAFDFLPKPFDVAELLGVIRRGLRYGARPAAGGGSPAGGAEGRYFLGRHGWAALAADGIATVGAGETFWNVLGEVSRIELPAAGSRVDQGQQLARLHGPEEVHRVWSPLSGLTVTANAELAGSPELVDGSPFDAGWLARIVPEALDIELRALTERPAGGG